MEWCGRGIDSEPSANNVTAPWRDDWHLRSVGGRCIYGRTPDPRHRRRVQLTLTADAKPIAGDTDLNTAKRLQAVLTGISVDESATSTEQLPDLVMARLPLRVGRWRRIPSARRDARSVPPPQCARSECSAPPAPPWRAAYGTTRCGSLCRVSR
jgi:hypothetical protein